jgi:hypothetical protein
MSASDPKRTLAIRRRALSVMIWSRWSGLFNGNRVRCRKRVLKGVVECFLLVSPRLVGENTVRMTRFTFWIGIHFHLSAARAGNVPFLKFRSKHDASKARWDLHGIRM